MAREQLGYKSPEGCEAPGLCEEAPTASSAAAVTLTADDAGKTFLWDAATGIDYTLPAPVAGMVFRFYCTVSVTSNAHAISTDAATTFIGGALLTETSPWRVEAAIFIALSGVVIFAIIPYLLSYMHPNNFPRTLYNQ